MTGYDHLPELGELARIALYGENATGGYQWGDTKGPDGGFGHETLSSLVQQGWAARTGREVKNQLGGVWPEVKVTPAGIQMLLKAGLRLPVERAVATLRELHPDIEFSQCALADCEHTVEPDESYPPTLIAFESKEYGDSISFVDPYSDIHGDEANSTLHGLGDTGAMIISLFNKVSQRGINLEHPLSLGR